MLERVHDVVLVDELQPGIEAQDLGTIGSESIRVNPVSTSGPSTFAQRSMVTVDLGVLARRTRATACLGLDDVALEAGAGRMGTAHLLGEEGRVVLLGPVVMGSS